MTSKTEIIGFFNNKKYDTVIDEFTKNRDKFIDDYEVQMLAGLSHSIKLDHNKAFRCYQRANKINSTIDSLYNIALTHNFLDNTEEAEKIYKKIISKDRSHLSSYINLSDIFIKSKRYHEAIELLADVEDKKTINVLVDYNLGVAFLHIRKYDKAVEYFLKVLSVDSNDRDANFNLANSYKYQGRLDEAIKVYNELIAKDQKDYESSFNLGICQLLRGNFIDGLQLYENRFNLKNNYCYSFNVSGNCLLQSKNASRDSVILVLYEQGFGDSINFSVYLNLLRKRFKKVICVVQEELTTLFNSSFDCEIISDYKDAPLYDYYIFIASLPLYFLESEKTFSSKTPYLNVPRDYLEKWSSRVISKNKKIGISWHSQKESLLDKNIPFNDFLECLPNKYDYYCIHKEINQEAEDAIQAKSNIFYFRNQILDFSDTAAICSQMDTVITIDTSVAHLSSALGIETFILLPYVPDWRWTIDLKIPVWYDNAYLVRQSKLGDWKNVLEYIKQNI